ncbi:hypothetical protein [Burkholderia anthina]|uniref:hypothetical protein n=1 Tax=Burkholderia anthina TaxID=179879 RepID=UPI001AA040DB|nr:hypothetical protein [Burkholderia anthina]QTD94783.1 hypothetical protein J4G50_37260 [Burkholderia anthina]
MPTVHVQTFRRLAVSLGTGTIAILVNTALLVAADELGLITARGGLLTLINQLLHVPGNLLARNWLFQQGFHIVVGIGMALFYVLVVNDPVRRPVVKSMLFALIVWLANSLVVLPLIGQGLAGTRVLSSVGIVYFAIAHTIFFLTNGLLLSRFAVKPIGT